MANIIDKVKKIFGPGKTETFTRPKSKIPPITAPAAGSSVGPESDSGTFGTQKEMDRIYRDSNKKRKTSDGYMRS